MRDRYSSKARLAGGVILFLLAALTRLGGLTAVPPGGPNALLLRLPSAVAGIVTILLLAAIVYKISGNFRWAWVSGMALLLTPWHIEQSRVVSPALLGLTVLLSACALVLWVKKPMVRFVSLGGLSGVFYLVYPSFWLFTPPYQFPKFADFLHNLFKLISYEFLFSKNDSFWVGGMRSVGVFTPFTLPLFLVGIYQVIKVIKVHHWPHLLIFIVIWILAAAHPLFPENREYFLITPYLSIIVTFGIIKLFDQFNTSKIYLKLFIATLFVLFVYEYLIFTHFYTSHYPRTVAAEVPYEKRDF